MYRALYRKWRPQAFTDVVGQQAITTALSNQIKAGKVGHAYLFTGTRGTGKTTCAKIFAKAVNCENPQGTNPCGECVCCQGLENGSILDVIEIDAASNNGVDDIRDLREETAYRPSRCAYKVYIIDEVHMLSTAAFNALLKIMEEPPSHVIFILATTEIHKVPATIVSRCQRYDFGRIHPERMAERLAFIAAQEEIELTDDAADLIARLADGALRDAISLLDTCAGVGGAVDEARVREMAGVADKDYLFNVSEAVAAGDVTGLLQLVASLREASIDVKRLTEELVFHYRNFLLASAQPDGSLLIRVPSRDRERYLETAPAVEEAFAIRAVRRLAAALDAMGRSPDPRIELELALFDLCETEQTAAPAAKQAAPVQAAPRPQQAVQTAAAPSVPAAPQPQAGAAQPPQATQPQEVPAPTPPKAVQPAPVAAVEPAKDVPPWESAETVSSEPEPAEAPAVPAAEVIAEPVPAPEETETQDVPTAPGSTPPEPEAPQQDAMPALSAPMLQVAAQEAAPPEPGAPPLFEAWPQVVEYMSGVDRMLHSYMKGSTAYIEGRRVLIDGGDMFLSYMREYEEAAEKIKAAIEQATGTRYAIGPYKRPVTETDKPASAQQTLQEWQAKGVPVEYET